MARVRNITGRITEVPDDPAIIRTLLQVGDVTILDVPSSVLKQIPIALIPGYLRPQVNDEEEQFGLSVEEPYRQETPRTTDILHPEVTFETDATFEEILNRFPDIESAEEILVAVSGVAGFEKFNAQDADACWEYKIAKDEFTNSTKRG